MRLGGSEDAVVLQGVEFVERANEGILGCIRRVGILENAETHPVD